MFSKSDCDALRESGDLSYGIWVTLSGFPSCALGKAFLPVPCFSIRNVGGLCVLASFIHSTRSGPRSAVQPPGTPGEAQPHPLVPAGQEAAGKREKSEDTSKVHPVTHGAGGGRGEPGDVGEADREGRRGWPGPRDAAVGPRAEMMRLASVWQRSAEGAPQAEGGAPAGNLT